MGLGIDPAGDQVPMDDHDEPPAELVLFYYLIEILSDLRDPPPILGGYQRAVADPRRSSDNNILNLYNIYNWHTS